MTNSDRLELISTVLYWYSDLQNKEMEPGPSMECFMTEHFNILREELQKLDEFLQ